ncbi:methyltransferase domain-containing protein [Acidovorax sp. sic0104]|uniref:methyltransferase domain-containing protein n=1 Tax=Acidovorax sp. sic0104 TaxID=2854784 RepID=UPI001C4588D1|nr:methyltransferase domain-containing protein [Acidovorax sp. sic0104]MBV7540387.1 class I SAM-dependent methyltransferase [Acidovorax sp. sic0104]
MHPSAIRNGQLFFDTYLQPGAQVLVVDIGAQDINGSLRQFAPPGARYLGLDFQAGQGVDQVLDDPYVLPLEEGSVDVVVSSSCFEHVEMFWLMFNEVLRVLKPHGLFYLNVPSNGDYHRFPVDCWRFYPDAGEALAHWSHRSGHRAVLLESFTTYQHLDIWNDFVAVFVKDEACVARHSARMQDRLEHCMNARRYGVPGLRNPQAAPEDGALLRALTGRPAAALCQMAAPAVPLGEPTQHPPEGEPCSAWARPAAPRNITGPESCHFYHTVDLPGFGLQRGDWDFRETAWQYLGHVDVAGKQVLEVGPANGFFTQTLEAAGARVIAYDLSPSDPWDAVPYGGVLDDPRIAVQQQHLDRLCNGWWLAHRLHGSRAQLCHGSVYDLPGALAPVDVAIVGAVLLHLRDPFLALQRICAMARETVVVTELMPFAARPPDWTGHETEVPASILADRDPPSMIFQPTGSGADAFGTWWHISPACLRQMLDVLGFAPVNTSFHIQRHMGWYGHVLYTVVARRKGPPFAAD